jgi:glucan phosphorylase
MKNYQCFKDVQTFKKAFIENVESKFAIDFEDSTPYQRYITLGKMVRYKIASDWERTRKSLDYQKLSEEEKANVGDEYECLDEDITEYRCKYEAAVSMANILDFYSKEYGTKVVAYMFGT